MLLKQAKIGPFKSFYSSQTVNIEDTVTVVVGMNESGKTVFLQSLEKSRDAQGLAKFDKVDDYPRKDLTAYLKKHSISPAIATVLTYVLSEDEIKEINDHFKTKLENNFSFTISHSYDNKLSIGISIEEAPVIESISCSNNLSTDTISNIKKATKLREIPELLKGTSLTDDDKIVLKEIEERIVKTKWDSIIQYEICEWLSPKIPHFLYFSEYDLLPSKTNLNDLAQRVTRAKNDPNQLLPENRAVLALLKMADISIEDFTSTGGYEPLKAKIEAISISLTDQIMEFWKQNENLEVEIDIRPDPEDKENAIFTNGPNLYLRIKNRRHRGVSTSFRQRSRGFIWFFSFLVWFDSVQNQLSDKNEKGERDIILLLDEPGLALHALAQADFLKYIDELAERHQVIYSTHSPFMVHSDRLQQVRVVEDTEKVGTVISDNISGSDPKTIFPLQAALGWTIAQSLFISEHNLLVEGPSELIYLKLLSGILESEGRTHLRENITIVPAGGLDKVATFIALLGANGLKIAVLYDYNGAPEQRLLDMVKNRIISKKALLNAAQFRDVNNIGVESISTDIEDLFDVTLYLEFFNKTFKNQLIDMEIKESDLPKGDRIIVRIEAFLESKGIKLRPTGGFNHYLVSSHIASNPPKNINTDTLIKFEELFKAINKLV